MYTTWGMRLYTYKNALPKHFLFSSIIPPQGCLLKIGLGQLKVLVWPRRALCLTKAPIWKPVNHPESQKQWSTAAVHRSVGPAGHKYGTFSLKSLHWGAIITIPLLINRKGRKVINSAVIILILDEVQLHKELLFDPIHNEFKTLMIKLKVHLGKRLMFIKNKPD